ncbi:uncharacterized protein E0L32_002178 [Thyridium curvatum]|uniref:Ferric-chelate reductase n=1 Tax=Thyridium curvatum TaxID=1093900 RepID=A0A507AFG7_9PEZI|nr:uncharacterized protein E0L32_001955 [Thyridium curvatum]XP_030989286.1 uncharacterized protein E0L32_002178 [Thyridium curvatum]TPX07352.1 hypothetical protein E0L32_001955 [Thyridium curvatum]TPX07575.1 hypothetical protein E0L32_002178 [Thyridium curvatum]
MRRQALSVALQVSGLFLQTTEATETKSRSGHGLIGYGISMYPPPCAFACKDAVSAPLNCTADTAMDMSGHGGMSMKLKSRHHGEHDELEFPSGDGWKVVKTAPAACKAINDFWLQTVAHCVRTRCPDSSISQLEKFWETEALGHLVEQPVPKMSYSQALASIAVEPSRAMNKSVLLDYVGAVSDKDWTPIYNADVNFEEHEAGHSMFGLIVLLATAVLPIAMSLLRFLPWPTALVSRFHAYLIDPPLFGPHHSTPVFFGLGIMPTRGQALFIVYIWAVNIACSAAGYHPIWPHSWYASTYVEVTTYVSNRVGILSFANLPVTILFSGRNNPLLWVTDWSHSTFLLVHRWVAFICMAQAVIHSIAYLYLYLEPDRDHTAESQKPYWYWGIIGTLGLSLMVPLSLQPIRARMYEAFLASHIVLAILALIGCFLHIFYRYEWQWGYENWVYTAAGVWIFDRLVRLARTARNGARRAFVTPIDNEYLRVDIPGVVATGHAYLHFPGVSRWKFWENHPFSVAGVSLGMDVESGSTAPKTMSDDAADEEKKTHQVAEAPAPQSSRGSSSSVAPPASSARLRPIGSTFFIRKSEGITDLLSRSASGSKGVSVLVESSYGPGATVLQEDPVMPTPEFPNVLCIAGGVGIAAILPILDTATTGLGRGSGSIKLYWGVRTMPLVHAVEDMLRLGDLGDQGVTDRCWGAVPVKLSVGERLDLKAVIESEVASNTGGTTVVVCGPAGMADEVRCIVSAVSRHGPVTRLVVHSFMW